MASVVESRKHRIIYLLILALLAAAVIVVINDPDGDHGKGAKMAASVPAETRGGLVFLLQGVRSEADNFHAKAKAACTEHGKVNNFCVKHLESDTQRVVGFYPSD